jgi:hypothetical protein
MNALPLDGSAPDTFGSYAVPGHPAAPGYDPTSNRRKQPGAGAYPFLLLLSTTVAGLFCYLYLTKPVIVETAAAPAVVSPPAPVEPKPALPVVAPPVAATLPPAPVVQDKSTPVPAPPALTPSSQRLPGDVAPAVANPREALGKTGASPFEETNLRVQHVLIAEAPGGARSRLEFEVPVLYRSRNLRWSQAEVGEARELLGKLADYQEKTRTLRAEGIALLDAWNQLIGRSIPSAGLRADSLSLPANQNEAASSALPAALDTTEAIRINPAVQ